MMKLKYAKINCFSMETIFYIKFKKFSKYGEDQYGYKRFRYFLKSI